MEQVDRVKNLQEFVKSDLSVMLATDVAARGLYLPLVNQIIQYSPPGLEIRQKVREKSTGRKNIYSRANLRNMSSQA